MSRATRSTGGTSGKSPFDFRPVAGHIFAANRLPGTADQSKGFWRRFLVVTFRRDFTNDPERDPDMADRLVAERARIVSWMLDGAVRLFRQKDYTFPASHVTALETWRRTSDQVAASARRTRKPRPTRVRNDGHPRVPGFRRLGQGQRPPPPSSTKWAARMKALGYSAVHTRQGNVYPIRIAGHDRIHIQREGL